MDIYTIGASLIFLGMCHTFIRTRPWYLSFQESIKMLFNEYGYPSWMILAGLIIIVFGYIYNSIFYPWFVRLDEEVRVYSNGEKTGIDIFAGIGDALNPYVSFISAMLVAIGLYYTIRDFRHARAEFKRTADALEGAAKAEEAKMRMEKGKEIKETNLRHVKVLYEKLMNYQFTNNIVAFAAYNNLANEISTINTPFPRITCVENLLDKVDLNSVEKVISLLSKIQNKDESNAGVIRGIKELLDPNLTVFWVVKDTDSYQFEALIKLFLEFESSYYSCAASASFKSMASVLPDVRENIEKFEKVFDMLILSSKKCEGINELQITKLSGKDNYLYTIGVYLNHNTDLIEKLDRAIGNIRAVRYMG